MRTILRMAVAVGALTALAACEDGKFHLGAKNAGGAASSASEAQGAEPAFSLVERDVEAPQAFSLKDKGLWDGRPSLGGVWVAHANVKDPERVIIRNPSNGKSVVGALFRREVANPGPALQVSSDAAAALDMLAGQPAELDVVALRREEPPKPEADAAVAAVAAEGEAAAATAADAAPAEKPAAKPATDGVDPIAAGAAAAIARAEGATTDGTAADGTNATEAMADAAPAAKKCPFWRKKKCLAEQAAMGPAPAPDAAATDLAAAGGTEATPAPATADVAVSAIPATPAAAGTLTRPFVQIGIFSVEANAQRAVDQMKAAGLTAMVRSDQSQGKKFWRVVIGPVASAAERDSVAAKVKGIGYPDAYPVAK